MSSAGYPTEQAGSGVSASNSRTSEQLTPQLPDRITVRDYIDALPGLRRRAYQRLLAPGVVSAVDIVAAFYELRGTLEQVLAHLLTFYPEKHFSLLGTKQYVSSLVASSTHWHYMRASTEGVGQSGTIVQTLTARGVVQDVERMIDEAVSSLTGVDVRRPSAEEDAWHLAWREQLPDGLSR
jgi:hypothetical protein